MRHHPKVVVGLVVVTLTAVAAAVYLVGRYAPIDVKVGGISGDGRLGIQDPVAVEFSLPINRRLLTPTIEPAIEGSWRWSGGRLSRRLTFQPETVWSPGQEYSLHINGTAPLLSSRTEAVQLKIATRELPTVVAATVHDNATDVAPEDAISVTINQNLHDAVDFTFRLEPAVEVSIEADHANQRYTIRPLRPLVAGQGYKLIGERELVHIASSTQSVVRREPKEKVFERLFTVRTPPSLVRFEPTGDAVAPTNRSVVLEFSAAMDQPSVDTGIQIVPRPAGAWRWVTERQLVFEVQGDLPYGTDYQISLPAGIRDRAGTATTEPAVLRFRTVGALRVVTTSPNRKSGVALGSPATLTFDQLPNQPSVAEALTVEPPTTYTLAWQGKSVVIQPVDGWAYNTRYKVTLRRGALGQYGLPSTTETIFTFTTEEKVVLLNIAWDRQDRALSCEAAALKMALAGKGVRVSEDEIMSRVGYDPTPRSPGGWGDPDEAFVGDINGAQNTTGYGVHWGPIARAAAAWRPARVVSGITLTEAARHLEAGNPIVIWGVMGAAYADPWVTPSGRTINAWKGEHVRTLIGFRGSVENPTSFIINDPIAGRLNWSAAKLRSDWSKFGFHGVVVE